MATKKVPIQLEQDKIFIKSVTPYDFKHMGQKGIEIIYTNGDTQMFTTPSPNPNCFGSHDFDSDEEMYAFYNEIKP